LTRGIPDTFFPTVRPARRAAPAAPTSKPTRKPFRLSTARFAPASPKPTVTTISKCSLLQLTTLFGAMLESSKAALGKAREQRLFGERLGLAFGVRQDGEALLDMLRAKTKAKAVHKALDAASA